MEAELINEGLFSSWAATPFGDDPEMDDDAAMRWKFLPIALNQN